MAHIPLEKKNGTRVGHFPTLENQQRQRPHIAIPTTSNLLCPADRYSFFGPFVSAKMPPQKKEKAYEKSDNYTCMRTKVPRPPVCVASLSSPV